MTTEASHRAAEPVSHRVERAATWLSLACAVHCLLVPLLVVLLPVAGASLAVLDSPRVELGLSLFVLVSAAAGAFWGFRRHGDGRVVAAMIVGLCVYALGHLLDHWLEPPWYGHVVGVAGALLLATGSFQSARMSHRHGAECAH